MLSPVSPFAPSLPSLPFNTVTVPIEPFAFSNVTIVPPSVDAVVAAVILSPSVPGFPLGIITLPITGFVVFVVLKLT